MTPSSTSQTPGRHLVFTFPPPSPPPEETDVGLHLHHRRRRIALYSHDAQGLGHIRRNLAIAGALAATGPTEPVPEILLVTGAPATATLLAPPGGDFLILPALGKDLDGTYRARTLAAPLAALIELRSRILLAALTTFDPDLLIVDKVPRGAAGELEPALAALRTMGRARCVLGLRDILDAAGPARRQWRQDRANEAVAHYYDAVWVYGDPHVFDPVAEYAMAPVVAGRTTYTGYLGHGRPAVAAVAHPEVLPPYDLCLVGGGQDGLGLAHSFVQARLPRGHVGVVVAGPYMAAEDRHALDRLAGDRADMSVLGSVDDAERLTAGATSVVAMGGYNTICEILAQGSRALIVPRTRPRTEQLVRAERLAARGLVEMMHPDHLTPRHLGNWLGAGGDRRSDVASGIDLHGLARIPALADSLLGAPTMASGRRSWRREVVDVAV